MNDSQSVLLSIAIPAYGRPKELLHCLNHFIKQIEGRYEDIVEIIVSDDASPNDELYEVRLLSKKYPYIKYRRYSKNIGLEKNLIVCTDNCQGEYLWIFGDDDFIEPDEDIEQIMTLLRSNYYDFIVLNRTRRSFDLSRMISDNWMKLDAERVYNFPGLREFCLKHGFISVIGFISVNIFRRIPFQKVDSSKYYGTMYPQLGSMVEAFFNKKTILIGRPMVCHRTQTAEEKKAALGNKSSEADFMSDVKRRNAIYFSHPYIQMLAELIRFGVFCPEDMLKIPENTVINGLLIDFLIQTVSDNYEMQLEKSRETWLETKSFFDLLPLDVDRRRRIDVLFANMDIIPVSKSLESRNIPTISVITPSYNQADYLHDCLRSVQEQSYKPIEHLVFDPGSTDNSRAIAASYPHVTLIAEPDEGQSDAVNKGFSRARGDIIAWINSDDYYTNAGVFERVVKRFNEDDAPDIVYGRGIYVDENGNKLRDVYINKNPASFSWRFQNEDGIHQPSLFMRRSVFERVGQFRNDLHYCMDYEYWIRCMKEGIKFAFFDENLSVARYHKQNKTYGMRENSYYEVCDMMKQHFGYANHIWLKRYAEFLTEGYDGVLATSDNTEVKNIERLNNVYCDLLLAYNGAYDTYKLLNNKASQKGYGDTLREMKSLGLPKLLVPCKEVSLEQPQEPGYVMCKVGPRRWAYDSNWKAKQITRTHKFFRERIKNRRNDTCIIVGNGPSLNKTDFSLLENQDVIVSNNTFLSSELLQYATYYTVVNYLVAEQSSQHINRINKAYKVIPYWLGYCINPGSNTFFVDAVGYPKFSKNIFKNMSWRHTVTFFNLHLAYGLGYRNVILIGFDHNYKQPKDKVEQEIICSYGEDENHFHRDYFRGKKWQAADVNKMEEMYRLAKIAFEEDGRTIINSTVGGKLELFKRMPLERALSIASHAKPAYIVVGPFSRHEQVHWDETTVICEIFKDKLSGSTMIDVGAHQGTALFPFLDCGWNVFAFEPDTINRSILLERLSDHNNKHLVSLDPRCVSSKSQVCVSFFTSEVSSGISSLSAFHETHCESQKVDIVSLTDYFEDNPVPAIDFLKIDTEGHDMFVLQGFPWERFKPAVIKCEFEDRKTLPLGYSWKDMADYLVGKGYKVYVSEWHPILQYGIKHDWHQFMRYPCELSTEKAWGNLLAFRDPIDEKKLIDIVVKNLSFAGKKDDDMVYNYTSKENIDGKNMVFKIFAKNINQS